MTRREPDRLFHYTCAHAAQQIDATGLLRPWPDAPAAARLADWLLPEPLVWLTDLDAPLRDALGLTQQIIGCDRTEYRYTVTDLTHCQPWTTYARRLPPADRRATETATPGLLPAHWWLSTRVVPVTSAAEHLTARAAPAAR